MSGTTREEWEQAKFISLDSVVSRGEAVSTCGIYLNGRGGSRVRIELESLVNSTFDL
jgi:hypothetical protein